MSPALSLSQYLSGHYVPKRPGISKGSIQQLSIAASLYSEHIGRVASLDDLTEVGIRGFMSALLLTRCARTVNDKRSMLLSLWRDAFDDGLVVKLPTRIKKIKEPARLPTAWNCEEVAKILSACQQSRRIHDWNGINWQALVLTIYDTSHRIGALLQVKTPQLTQDGVLLVLAEQTKHKRDTLHRLHAQTLEAIRATKPNGRLFPWPLRKRQIWIEFRAILEAAGLPSTRRDLFHKLRRTSYTHTFCALGQQAASAHAAHAKDLSRVYLDPRFIEAPSAADSIPRPHFSPPVVPR